jgi:methylated-DNA-protein-cysteine methyltransferase related protein
MAADPNFNEHVFEVVRLIPSGRVTSYGAIAKFLGKGNWSRKVGHAMGLVHGVEPPVPYYRVVNSQGLLTGGTSGIEARIVLLEKEGVDIKGNKVLNFRSVFWDPSKELIY